MLFLAWRALETLFRFYVAVLRNLTGYLLVVVHFGVSFYTIFILNKNLKKWLYGVCLLEMARRFPKSSVQFLMATGSRQPTVNLYNNSKTCVCPVPTYCAAVPQTFEPSIGTLVTPTMGNVHTNFTFSTPVNFWDRSPYRMNERMGSAGT